ncbi:metal ABC transporter ATP-binding protein [Epidermidibacterium keratini]
MHIGGQAVLCGVSLQVHRGDVLAVIGPNGSGKSTLIKAMVGLYRPSSGTVRLIDPDTGRRLPRGRLGYVPQRVAVGGSLPATVREIVASGLPTGIFSRAVRHSQAAIADALQTVGLSELADRPVTALSGGQQQRTLIARALVRDPELLVMDEPLAGVDLSQQEAFAGIIERLRTDGRTVVLVLHEFGPLAPVITRVVALADGRVEYDAGPERAPEHCDDHPVPSTPFGMALPSAPHDHVHPHDDAAPTDVPWTSSDVRIEGPTRR